MPIQETISGTTPSAETAPANGVSDVVVELRGPGKVYLEAKAPNSEWRPIGVISGAVSVATPDTAILYRFRPEGVEDQANVYFGP